MTGSWTLDSLEDGIATLLRDSRRVQLPAGLLPLEAREGTRIEVELVREGALATLRLRIAPAPTEALSGEVTDRLERLRGLDPGGDLTL
jgi:hypothetical protein